MLASDGQMLGLAPEIGLFCQGWLLAQGFGTGFLCFFACHLPLPPRHSLKCTELSRRFEHGCQHTWSTPGSSCGRMST